MNNKEYLLEEHPTKRLILDRRPTDCSVQDITPGREDMIVFSEKEEMFVSEDVYISPAYSFGGPEKIFVLNRFFISADEASLRKILKSDDIRIIRHYEWADMYLLELSSVRHSREVLEYLSDLPFRDSVRWAHPDLLYPKHPRYIPNDPLFEAQWHLSSDESFRHIQAPNAWSVTTGDHDIIIAIIDDGIDVNHAEFEDKLVAGRNIIEETGNIPAGRHGTACAGLAAAQGDNGIGIAGVAFDSSIMPIYLLDNRMTIAHEVQAFEWAVEQGADIITNSWGPPDAVWKYYAIPDAVGEVINYAVTQGRDGKGIPVFWASGNGNERTDIDGYASHPLVINVGASNYYGERSEYSDYGETLDIVAPSSGAGHGLVTTAINNGYRNNFGGTSGSAPIAAGAGALVLSQAEHLTWRGVKAILQRSADPIDFENGLYNEHGFSPWYGYGKVNAGAAVELALTPSTSPPAEINDLEFFIHGNKAFLEWTAPGNNGAEGQALYYDLRWSTSEITDDNFSSAHIYYDIFLPSTAGSEQLLELNNLQREKEIYFALKTYDNRENASEISNIVSGVIPAREENQLLHFFDFSASKEGWYGDEPWARVPGEGSSGYVWMDSPDGNYANNIDVSLYSPVFDFSQVQYVQVSVVHKYSIVEQLHVGYWEVSIDGGTTWHPPIHGSTGYETSFINESFSLQYADEKDAVQFRFRLKTDHFEIDKGWAIDSVSFYGVPLDEYVAPIIISGYEQIPAYPTVDDNVQLQIRALHPEGLETAQIFLRFDDGEFDEHALQLIEGTSEDGLYNFEIPMAEDGTTVQYYFYFATGTANGQERYYPAQAPLEYFEYTVFAPVTWYVSNDGSNTNSGTSWQEAFQRIQAALESAQKYDSIWVREGIYEGEITIPSDIAVYGGFSGQESILAERDYEKHETIITGNGQSRGVTNSGILDGFTVQDGIAYNGGGIYNNTQGFVINCRIHSNEASNWGGGIFNQGTLSDSFIYNNTAESGGGVDNSGTVINCVVRDNQVETHGGGLYNDGGLVDASVFYHNEAGDFGGGVSNDGIILNSVLYENQARNGGGLDNYGGEVINCTIAGNTAANQGGGLFNDVPLGGTAHVVNTIIWDNASNNQSQDYHSANTNATIEYSIFSEADGTNNNISQDPFFVHRENKDLRLTKHSPGIDSGSADGAPAVDFNNIPRPRGEGIDRGAYEYEGIAPAKPVNIFPDSDSLRPEYVELRCSVFQSKAFDSGHYASRWQVASDSAFADRVWDSDKQEDALTAIQVIPHLETGRTYYWRVRHQDIFLAVSSWSQSTTFTVDEKTSVEGSIYLQFE